MRKIGLVGVAVVAACAGCAKIEVGSPRSRRRGPRPPVGPPAVPRHGHGRDAYEPNNDTEGPSRIALGQTQTHTIHADGDEDWLACPVPSAGRYVVRITRAAVEVSVEVWLRRGDVRTEGKEAATFNVRGSGGREVRVPPGVRSIKLKIESEDDDERGPYCVTVYRE